MIFHHQKLRELREARGLTRKEVANQLGISVSNVSLWENNKARKPLPSKISKLAKILQCEVSDLAEFGKSKSIKFNRENFHRIRMERGLSQQEIANACGVSGCIVSNWENGITIPRPAKIGKLAEILYCEKSDLAIHRISEDEQGINELLIGIANTLDTISETLKRIEKGGIK